MQVSVENINTLERKLTITVPAELVKRALQSEVSSLSKVAQKDGFRKGKVPKSIVEKRAINGALDRVYKESLTTALQEKNLRPAASPMPINSHYDEGKNFEFTVQFEVYPEIQLTDFSQIVIDKPQINVTKDDLDSALEKLQSQFAEWREVVRPAVAFDKVLIDYTSTINGKPYEHNSGEEVTVELGSNNFLKGFEDAIIGANAGDTVEFDVEFPIEWRLENIAGKFGHFVVDVKQVSEKVVPNLDENFARKIGADDVSLEGILSKIKSNVETQALQMSERTTKENLYTKLLEANTFEIPKVLVDLQVKQLHEDLHRNQGDKQSNDCQHIGLHDEARKRVAIGLLLSEIIHQESLSIDTVRVQNRITQIGQSFGNAAFVESMYHESEELMTSVQNAVITEQAVDHVLSKVQMQERTYTFSEFFQSHAHH